MEMEEQMEANEFFDKCNNESGFASNYFEETKEAHKFVKELQKCGCKVKIGGILDEVDGGGKYADTLYISCKGESPIETLKLQKRVLCKLLKEHPDEFEEEEGGVFRVWWD